MHDSSISESLWFWTLISAPCSANRVNVLSCAALTEARQTIISKAGELLLVKVSVRTAPTKRRHVYLLGCAKHGADLRPCAARVGRLERGLDGLRFFLSAGLPAQLLLAGAVDLAPQSDLQDESGIGEDARTEVQSVICSFLARTATKTKASWKVVVMSSSLRVL